MEFIKFENCSCFPEYQLVKGNLIIYKCLSCNKCSSKKLNEESKKKFKNNFKFSNDDINKFILLLRKGICPSEYMMIEKRLMKQHYLKKRIL